MTEQLSKVLDLYQRIYTDQCEGTDLEWNVFLAAIYDTCLQPSDRSRIHVDTQLHHLWGLQVGLATYDKSVWNSLQEALWDLQRMLSLR